MKTSLIILSCLLVVTLPSTHANHHPHPHPHENSTEEEESTWKITYDLVIECSQKPSMVVCLKLKAVKFLDKAVASKEPFPLMEYISFSPDPTKEVVEEKEELPSEEEIEASLPRSLDDQSGQLDTMIQDKIASILQRRTLQLTIPMDFEGRGKKGKYGAALLIGLGMAGMIGQLIMGKIALIAGKALVIAKVALVLSAIVGLKKLFGKNNDSDTSVVYAGGGDGGWGHRSLEEPDMDAQSVAYSAHAPNGEQISR